MRPRSKHPEDLASVEIIEARLHSAYDPLDGDYDTKPLDFKWLAAIENTVHSPQLLWLHYHLIGDQFTGTANAETGTVLAPDARIRDLAGQSATELTALGVKQGAPMRGTNG